MKKGEFEAQQILLMFEIIFALAVILTFYVSLYEDNPTQFKDIDTGLSKSTILYGENIFDNVQMIEDKTNNLERSIT